MTCIYTGAYIFLANYDAYAPADIYQIDPNFYIFRFLPESLHYFPIPGHKITHRIEEVLLSSEWFHRPDIGITVVPAKYVTVLLPREFLPA